MSQILRFTKFALHISIKVVYCATVYVKTISVTHFHHISQKIKKSDRKLKCLFLLCLTKDAFIFGVNFTNKCRKRTPEKINLL